MQICRFDFLNAVKRSNHSRLQRQSKHGALRRLKGRAAAPFPDKYVRSEARGRFIGKTLYPTATCKRAFENGNDRPATHRKGKNKVGLRASRRQGQPPPKDRRAGGRHAAGYLRRKYRSLLGNFPNRNTPYR